MSDFISTACIATAVHTRSLMVTLAERVKDETRGQTAAEYMGVLLLVAVIIAAIVGSGIGTDIAGFLHDKVQSVSDGTAKAPCTGKDC